MNHKEDLLTSRSEKQSIGVVAPQDFKNDEVVKRDLAAVCISGYLERRLFYTPRNKKGGSRCELKPSLL